MHNKERIFMKFSLFFLFSLVLMQQAGWCDDSQIMIPTDQRIHVDVPPIYNQREILKSVEDFVEIPVLFPTLIKGASGKIYFAYTDISDFKGTDPKSRYFVSVGYEPGCFAHYCTLGYVSAEFKGKISSDVEVQHDGDQTRQVEVQKVPVTLSQGIKGYYTPGFGAGSYVEPKIQWHYKNVLYTLSWATASQKDLVQMANSAMMAELNKNK